MQRKGCSKPEGHITGDSPPVDETVVAHHDITSIIWAEGWLNDTASAHPAEEIGEQLGALAGRLGLAELVRVDVVILVRLAAGLVPTFEELGDVRVVQHA